MAQQTTTPGVCAQHCIISDDCRRGRTDAGAFEEAVDRLRQVYDRVCGGWGTDSGLKLHLVLTVEKPQRE